MELRAYWAVVQRRWGLVVGIAAVALLVSLVLALRGPVAYEAKLSLAVSVLPEPRTGPYFTYNSYYEWLSSEYLADDLSKLIESRAFAEDVGQALGEAIPANAIAEATRVRKTHRILEVSVLGGDPVQVDQIAKAVEQVLGSEDRLGYYFAQLKVNNGQVRIINRPTVGLALTSFQLLLQLLLRMIIGLIVGVGLAFLLDYLDNSVRERQDLERILGLPVLAEIPKL